MILCALSDLSRVLPLHPELARVDRFLREADLKALPEGRTDLNGDACFVLASPAARLRPASEAFLEVHRRHLDVQVVLEGEDRFGWAPLSDCAEVREAYDEGRDIAFFEDAPVSVITVPQGHLAIFFPEDAHAPLIGGQGSIHKLVFKLRLG